eukprot:2873942-Pleurochrysis_carterae.AAC.1
MACAAREQTRNGHPMYVSNLSAGINYFIPSLLSISTPPVASQPPVVVFGPCLDLRGGGWEEVIGASAA